MLGSARHPDPRCAEPSSCGCTLDANGEEYEDYRVPNYTHDGRWYETTIHQLPEVPQSGDVYEITWMATYNTDSWGTATIAFQ